MWRTLGISQIDWNSTPTAVRTAMLRLHHQAHSNQLRALGGNTLFDDARLALNGEVSRLAQFNRSTARVDSMIRKIMRKRNFVFALILVALTTSSTLAQNAAKTSARNVKGQILSSDNLPPLRVKFKKPFKFVGSQSFVLYEKAQVEQFFFVEAEERGQIKRLYIAQFEGSLPNAGATYNYPATQTTKLGKETYVVNAEVVSTVSAELKQNPQSDFARAASFLESKGFRVGEEITFQRFVRVVDEAKQNEIILLYVEAGNAFGSTEKTKQEFAERAVKGFKVMK